MNVLLQVNNLSISYLVNGKYFSVLKNASFCIKRGDVVGLVGESGAGKTTIAMSLIDLLPENAFKTSDQILCEGSDITSMTSDIALKIRGKEIGLCLQDALASLNPVLRIGYQLTEVIKCHFNVSSIEAKKRILKLLKDVHFNEPEKVLRLYPHELSGGMRQRILLIMTVVTHPKLLILDEPTASLDKITERSIISFILELKKKFDLTILLISHNTALIEKICDRTFLLKDSILSEQNLLLNQKNV